MAQVALYIGIKDGVRHLLEAGDPRDLRARFKNSDGEGFDALEVFESTVGRSRRRVFVKEIAPKAAPAPTPDIGDIPVEPEDEAPADEVETLITIAKGDGRKAEVKEAREKLDSMGIAY